MVVLVLVLAVAVVVVVVALTGLEPRESWCKSCSSQPPSQWRARPGEREKSESWKRRRNGAKCCCLHQMTMLLNNYCILHCNYNNHQHQSSARLQLTDFLTILIITDRSLNSLLNISFVNVVDGRVEATVVVVVVCEVL